MEISFTICSANYLPYAKSLGDSLVEHNTNQKFIIILLDIYPNIDPSFFFPHNIIHATDMGLTDFSEISEKYTTFELSCAMKPYVADYIFKTEKECNKLFYFDSDILVFDKLSIAEEALEDNSILLTPHLVSSKEFVGKIEIEKNLLRTGIYNAGFFALKRSNETDNFLKWWIYKMKKYCYNDLSIGLFVDQLWLNLAPTIFKGIKLISDDGYNVAYWNLDERKITLDNEKYFINETYPLVFYHFSGYDIDTENILSKYFPQQTFEKWPICFSLFNIYKTKALNNNNDFFSLKPQIGKKIEMPVPIVIREKNFFKRKYKKWFIKNP
jgi:hypothetical protein